jgi:hypothetical protein
MFVCLACWLNGKTQWQKYTTRRATGLYFQLHIHGGPKLI